MARPYTETQEKLLEILSDGRRHTRLELSTALPYVNGHSNSLAQHISFLRKKLNPKGEEIVCEFFQKKIHYRHVRLIGRS